MFVPVNMQGRELDYQPFEAFGVALKDMSAPLAYVGDRLLAGVAQQFESEGSWGNQPWAELKQGYREWKEAKAPNLPKLVGLRAVGQKGTRGNPIGKSYVASGKMRAELLAPAAVRVSPTRMVYSPVSDIAGYHQEGTSKMAARPPVVIPLHELSEWDDAFGAWLDGLTERLAA